ncbi:MAG: cob(I)yrinic acid a,c-diamide adenosyltransferase [Candidatus Dormibacteria bacterium]
MADAPEAGKSVPVTTRRGDGGYTSLWGGDEVPKYDLRPEAYGTLDEAGAAIAMARTRTNHPRLEKELLRLQNDLFRLMSELAAGQHHAGDYTIGPDNLADIEARIVRVRDECHLPQMFVIPSTQTSAILDLARTIIRRAERVVARMLHEKLITNGDTLRYLNRASDLAFVLARWEEKLDGVDYRTISAADLED